MSLELPLVVVDVQRGGPSTGLPTKTEQADLLQAMFGRNGESPVPIVAPQLARPTASTPRSRPCASPRPTARRCCCCPTATSPTAPSRGASRTSPTCPTCACEFATEPNGTRRRRATPVFHPYLRDPETLARPWAVPGTPGLEHRIGGIEKADVTGDISYDPDNHDPMVRLRQAKIDGIARHDPALEVDDPTGDAEVLVLGWGSTYGPIAAAARLVRDDRRHGRPGPPAPPQPVPGQHRRGAPPLPAGPRPGDEPRPARRCCCARKYLVDVQSLHPGARAAVQRDELADVIQQAVACRRRVTEGVSR